MNCSLCHSDQLHRHDTFDSLGYVGSDCQAYSGEILELYTCQNCGLTQKATNNAWDTACDTIYRQYNLYFQSPGNEQGVRDDSQNAMVSRSEKLVHHLESQISFQQSGKLLDIGCGNGHFLHRFANKYPSWELYGYEQEKRDLSSLYQIAKPKEVFHAPMNQIPIQFDLISLIHTIEHLPDAASFLSEVKTLLKPNANFFIQCPNVDENPFDLIIADHCSHYNAATLQYLLNKLEYSIQTLTPTWVSKELSAIVSLEKNPTPASSSLDIPSHIHNIDSHLTFLHNLIRQATNLRTQNSFGIFGTAIAAVWLATQSETLPDFFIDEDPTRIGQTLLNRPILSPSEVPQTASVLIALPPTPATQLHTRLTPPQSWHTPTP